MREVLSEIRSVLDLHNVKLEDRAGMTQLLVAESLGNVLTIPSSAVENPIQFFRLTHREQLISVLSEINEQVVIDIDETVHLCYKLWVTRYRLVHEAGSAVTKRLLIGMIGAGGYDVPPGVADLAQRYPNAYGHRYIINAVKEATNE